MKSSSKENRPTQLQKEERRMTTLRPMYTLRYEIPEMEFGFSSGPFVNFPMVPLGPFYSVLFILLLKSIVFFKLSLRYTFWILITTLRSCWTAFCWFVYILRIVCKYNNYVPLYKRGMMSVTCWLFSHGMIVK